MRDDLTRILFASMVLVINQRKIVKLQIQPVITAAEFKRMSGAAKRVAIAKDIIAQIKAHQYNITTGHWLSFETPKFDLDVDADMNTQQMLLGGKMKQEVDVAPAECTCCAVGAACASAIRLFNRHELPSQEVDGFDEGKKILKAYFPEKQVELIEIAFEMRQEPDMHDQVEDETKECRRAVAFGERYESDSARAKAIFTNIVKNNGTFKP